MLERAISTEQEEPYPIFLLSVACLFADKFTRADQIIEKILKIEPEYLPVIQLQAFLSLKSATEFESALSVYLNLIEKHPGDPHIHRGLKLLRKVVNFQEFQKNARLIDFVHIPKPPRYLKKKMKREKIRTADKKKKFRSWIALKIMLVIIALSALTGTGLLFYSGFFDRFTGKETGESRGVHKIDMVSIGGSNYELIKKINKQEVPVFYYSAGVMSDDFNKAKSLIKAEKYNEALGLLNKINNSNANFIVKEKVNFLIKFILEIEDRNFENVPYSRISKAPFLYRGYALKWAGRVTNLKKKNGKCSFTLLVDYQEKDVFSGIADIYSEEIFTDLSNGDIVELKAVFFDTLGDDRKVYLSAKGIKKL